MHLVFPEVCSRGTLMFREFEQDFRQWRSILNSQEKKNDKGKICSRCHTALAEFTDFVRATWLKTWLRTHCPRLERHKKQFIVALRTEDHDVQFLRINENVWWITGSEYDSQLWFILNLKSERPCSWSLRSVFLCKRDCDKAERGPVFVAKRKSESTGNTWTDST